MAPADHLEWRSDDLGWSAGSKCGNKIAFPKNKYQNQKIFRNKFPVHSALRYVAKVHGDKKPPTLHRPDLYDQLRQNIKIFGVGDKKPQTKVLLGGAPTSISCFSVG